jgi:hypothetical protein
METASEVHDRLEADEIILNDPQASEKLLKQIFDGSWMTQAIWVTAELGIADILATGSCSIKDLADQTNTQSNALYRIMRALASVGIFAQEPDGRFSITPPANLLRSNVPRSQRSFAIMMGAEFHGAWGELLHTVRTGEPGFRKRFGNSAFQYMVEHPERHSIYDSAMGGYGQAEGEAMLDVYDFSAFRTVMDVGGGSGMLMAAILNRHPDLKGMLFDLPSVVDRARSFISDAGLTARCRIEGGDFFSSVPSGADVYVMQHILHDWEDPDAISILRNCREAMNSDGRILLIETVIPNGNEPCFGKWLDLMMLLVGGRERTEEEYRKLLSAAGLTLNRVIPTALEVSIIEGLRAF